MKNLAQAIPARYRAWTYSILGTVVGLEAVLDFVPAGVESKALAVLVVLGFGMAVGNTSSPMPPPPPGGGAPENYPGEFA
jgi:hypothetical protein